VALKTITHNPFTPLFGKNLRKSCIYYMGKKKMEYACKIKEYIEAK
jgi:hypothetical protein